MPNSQDIVQQVAAIIRAECNHPQVRIALSDFFAGHRLGDAAQSNRAHLTLRYWSSLTDALLAQLAAVARTCSNDESRQLMTFVRSEMLGGQADDYGVWYRALI